MEKHKRFLVFTYDNYYPGGGMDDFKASFDTLEECISFLSKKHYDGYNVYDRIEGIEIDFINKATN